MIGREYAAKRLKDSAQRFNRGLEVPKKRGPTVAPECILQAVVVSDGFTKVSYDFWRPFRALHKIMPNPGLKPRAESFNRFAVETDT
jgi:hypothetical protein